MENRYGLYSQGSSGWTSMRNEEFQEADVWGVLFKERKDSDSNYSINSFKEPSLITRRLPTAARMIPNSSNKLMSSTSSQEVPKIIHHSAPVNIPDWSKIYGLNNSKNTSLQSDGDGNDDGFGRSCSWESEEEDAQGNLIPPHQYIARKLARNRIYSFSVCEGAGRTLKGRDLSRVRNAVLTKTGFLESSKSNYH